MLELIGTTASVTSRIIPVSPKPPTVSENTSDEVVGEAVNSPYFG